MMMQNAELEILAITHRNDANFAGKLLTRAVNLEKTMHKKAANPHADQSKGLTAPNTTGTGCHNNYTTAAARNLFEDTTPNPEYSCQYEHYVALADTVNRCLYQTGKLIGKLREDIRHE